jgi:hypothetical protein
VVAEFDRMPLSDAERLAALATAIAHTALCHHARHKGVYLDAVKTWSLEIGADFAPPPARVGRAPNEERVADAAEGLIGGIDAMIDWLGRAMIRTQERLVAELAIVAQLLGRFDAHAIHVALAAVAQAIADPDFTAGDIVNVELPDTGRPIPRSANLALLSPRGFA